MNALNIGRKMTSDDREQLEAAAKRFAKKWDIEKMEGLSYLQAVEDTDMSKGMSGDWRRRIKRALRGYTRWSYGYIGD